MLFEKGNNQASPKFKADYDEKISSVIDVLMENDFVTFSTFKKYFSLGDAFSDKYFNGHFVEDEVTQKLIFDYLAPIYG